MNILQQIAERIKGHECDKIIKRMGNEIVLSGVSIIQGDFKMNLGNYSNKIKELVKVPEVAVVLDDMQYHLCRSISEIKSNEEFREKCISIRLQHILAINQLRVILSSIRQEPTEDLKKELIKWLRYMNELNKHSITLLNPASTVESKSSLMLTQIMEYQRINNRELQEAVNILM